MKKFSNLHYWLILVFIVVLYGFKNYFIYFKEASFQQHLHSLSAIAWFGILAIQPWIYNNKSIKTHRKVGIIGVLIAGAVTASSLMVIKTNFLIDSGPLMPVKYTLTLANVIIIAGFVFSVVMAIIKSKDVDAHARWMISTVFWIMAPATFRIAMRWHMTIVPDTFPNVGNVLAISTIIPALVILILIGLDFYRKKRSYFPYYLVVAGNLFCSILFVVYQDGPIAKDVLEGVFQ
ncbi:hypothetical protein OO013_15875 [Mangrovivirga sp. M17]|uniref:Uncharacterized protein n=1 Tax=Mangrovivirga halotolerans TaxID=2993936 RepID=A0ABT3RVU4_9BACT|nr:hypothetical protein [Mangrovivirga halotolerans]MCX2745357.1 hypothetical protein [Mangrovivirga halotolerans]